MGPWQIIKLQCLLKRGQKFVWRWHWKAQKWCHLLKVRQTALTEWCEAKDFQSAPSSEDGVAWCSDDCQAQKDVVRWWAGWGFNLDHLQPRPRVWQVLKAQTLDLRLLDQNNLVGALDESIWRWANLCQDLKWVEQFQRSYSLLTILLPRWTC